MRTQPVIGITMGDPAGIGPEVVARTLAAALPQQGRKFIIYGSNELLTMAVDQCDLSLQWCRVDAESPRAGAEFDSTITVVDDARDDLHDLPAKPSDVGGHVSKHWVEQAIADAIGAQGKSPRIDALVTAPICKESWEMAGYRWPGHTELLANRSGAKRHAMMFASPLLRVVLATCHVPLMDIRNVLTIGRVHDAIDLAAEGCRKLGFAQPRIGVAGLNPHAGEGGRLGDEERRIIEPAVSLANDAGHDVTGPLPGDTIFSRALDGAFDVVVAMYHDQGLLPVKLLERHRGVNWTLGLPIIRTSPDHGTAFDIAGTGRADPGSMIAATELAAELARPVIASAP